MFGGQEMQDYERLSKNIYSSPLWGSQVYYQASRLPALADLRNNKWCTISS